MASSNGIELFKFGQSRKDSSNIPKLADFQSAIHEAKAMDLITSSEFREIIKLQGRSPEWKLKEKSELVIY